LAQATLAAEVLSEIQTVFGDHAFVTTERAGLALIATHLERLKAASEEDRLAFVFEALAAIPKASLGMQFALKGITATLLRGNLPLNSLSAIRILELVAQRRMPFPYKAILTALEDVPRSMALLEATYRLKSCIDEWHGGTEMSELHGRIDALIGGKQSQLADPVAGWVAQVLEAVNQSANKAQWRALLEHATSLSQSTAPKKWRKEAVELIDKIGRADVLDAGRRWLAIAPMPASTQMQVPDAQAAYQKGLVWALGSLGDTSIAPDIANFAFACFRKIPMIGAVSQKVGNACVNALAVMPGLEAVSQLSRLAARVKYDVAKRLIEKALNEAAARNGVSRDDLEAMSVPNFGLDAHGVRSEVVGDCQARLSIANGEAHLEWLREGKPLKSIPASVKENHRELANDLKKAAKELDGVLAAQRVRLERQLLSGEFCRFDLWKQWYLDHPVVSYFGKNLIWEVGAHTALYFQGRLVDWAGHSVEASADTPVRLWHPICSGVQTALSWRAWLEDHGVQQPFKQAHREVYILTEAERQTATFSNRFAGHIIRQHQFAALCRERGWQFNLMGQWDSHNTPYLELPRHKLRVEFDVDFPPNEQEATGHGVFLLIRTGQVRFKPLDNAKPDRFEFAGLLTNTAPITSEDLMRAMPQPARLDSISPVVFSEVMRDCDLFVGVTSIGADPNWNNQHPNGPHQAYWHEFAFGELTAAAENRRSILEALLPKLSLRDRAHIEGRYLVVRGDLHEYRIHLGSGNVMIEPGSRYLCIVQDAGDTAARVQLPFEGDRILALILSKAFLLLNDSKIKDETIRRQL